MEFCGDYHLHTFVSDGHADVAAHVAAAKSRGLKQIAISDHSFSTLFYHATQKKLAKQKAEIEMLGNCGIKIFQGVEGNLIGGSIDVPHGVIRNLDMLTVGFHRFITPARMQGESNFIMVNGFGNGKAKEKLRIKNTEAYINVIENYPVDIIAHLGHRAPVDIVRVCECAAKHSVYIELNAKHLDAIAHDIRNALVTDVKFIVGSDAHNVVRTGDFAALGRFIEKYGIPVERIFGVNGNFPVFKDKKEWTYGHDL